MCKTTNNFESIGGFVIAPENIVMKKEITTDNQFAIGTKYTYMVLRHLNQLSKINGTEFKPTYAFVKKYFGINCVTYTKALSQLEKIGALKVHLKSTPGGIQYLSPELIEGNFESFEKIPKIIITTSLLTVYQKMVLCMLWKYLYDTPRDSALLVTYVSVSQITKILSESGISERMVYKVLKQLSDPKEGYITLLNKTPDHAICLNIRHLIALYDFELYYNSNKKHFKIEPFHFTLNVCENIIERK